MKPSISNHVLPVWCKKTLSFLKWHFMYLEFRGTLTSYHWIPCIAGHCSLLSYLSHLLLPVLINEIDLRYWNVFWPMNTAGSREYRLLPSNTTRPYMHKANTRLQALAEGTNYLCNKKADTFLMWLLSCPSPPV